MALTRRQLLGLSLGSTAAALAGVAYLQDESMSPALPKESQLLADFHCHPGNTYSQEDLVAMLSSSGLVGLTVFNTKMDSNVLTYEQALQLPGVQEIDQGMLARIEFNGSKGYFTRTQEVVAGIHHILAVGFEGNYFPQYEDPRKAVEDIHRRNGVAILNHPYVTPDHAARIVKYRFITADEEMKVIELCQLVDEIEVFNAQCLNPTLGIIVPNMKTANSRAVELAAKHDFKGISATDTHIRLEQVKHCGIYISEKNLSIDRIKDNIQTGNFDNSCKRYISRLSFARGMFGI